MGYPKETVEYTFYHISKGKIFIAKNGSFLEKEFLSKEVSRRKVELDEVIVPSTLVESSPSQKLVLVIHTPISEEANDDNHETSDQVTTEPHRSSRVRSSRNRLSPCFINKALHQSGTVILFWKSCY